MGVMKAMAALVAVDRPPWTPRLVVGVRDVVAASPNPRHPTLPLRS